VKCSCQPRMHRNMGTSNAWGLQYSGMSTGKYLQEFQRSVLPSSSWCSSSLLKDWQALDIKALRSFKTSVNRLPVDTALISRTFEYPSSLVWEPKITLFLRVFKTDLVFNLNFMLISFGSVGSCLGYFVYVRLIDESETN